MNHIPVEYYFRVLPEIVLTAFAMLIMLVEGPDRGGRRGRLCGILALLGTLLALASVSIQARYPGDAFNNMFRVDSFTIFLHLVLLGGTAVVILASMDSLRAQGLERGEFYALLLFATVGMGMMVGATELIMMFISLEISSISSYVLAGYRRHDGRSTESALKYLLLGSFATAFFLYGIAMLYGAAGNTEIYTIAHNGLIWGTRSSGLVYAAAGLMFVGLAFKVSAAPFQVWTPDVYQGAPSIVTGFMSAGPKAAAFAIFLRIFYVALHDISGVWFWLVYVAAILSMCLGNLAALRQRDVKRMLAYSSIAQAGYILVAFAAVGQRGASAVLFYLAGYVAMNLGAFAVVAHVAGRDERTVTIDDYAGLGYRCPFQAATLALFLLSLIGVPLTAGFFGKLYVFESAIGSHLIGLTIVALLNSAVAAWYYLSIIAAMYMKNPEGSGSISRPSLPLKTALVACSVAVLWLGIFPSHVLQSAWSSAASLLVK